MPTLNAEELRRDLRQLVRLVDDDRIRARQQLAEALVLQHQVGHQQVVIDDHDVGRLRFAARPDHEAVLERGHSVPRQFSRVEVTHGQTGSSSPSRASSAMSPRRVVVRPGLHLRQHARDLAA